MFLLLAFNSTQASLLLANTLDIHEPENSLHNKKRLPLFFSMSDAGMPALYQKILHLVAQAVT
jgi:hypothetical protein